MARCKSWTSDPTWSRTAQQDTAHVHGWLRMDGVVPVTHATGKAPLTMYIPPQQVIVVSARMQCVACDARGGTGAQEHASRPSADFRLGRTTFSSVGGVPAPHDAPLSPPVCPSGPGRTPRSSPGQ
jgi:hypothetical protein